LNDDGDNDDDDDDNDNDDDNDANDDDNNNDDNDGNGDNNDMHTFNTSRPILLPHMYGFLEPLMNIKLFDVLMNIIVK
jgi:hypothetical protein